MNLLKVWSLFLGPKIKKMNKKIIADKTIYGGMYVDKYFFIFKDGSDLQVSPQEWDQYKSGDQYTFPESFDKAVKDIEEGKTVPLNTALNEPYKELDNIDSLKLHNHVLKVANDELDEENKRLKKEFKILEKLIELNMKDLWDIADQRDWYYEEYQKLKNRLTD